MAFKDERMIEEPRYWIMEGYKKGYNEGYEKGYNEGYEKGYKDAIVSLEKEKEIKK